MSTPSLPDFSVLAAKPPQRPTANLASRPSTSNYASAIASAAEQDNQSTNKNKPSGLVIESETNDGKAGSSLGSDSAVPASATWRPNLDRQQSWSMQDRKRAMQSPLMSPKLERGKGGAEFGFSSKDGQAGDQEVNDEA